MFHLNSLLSICLVVLTCFVRAPRHVCVRHGRRVLFFLGIPFFTSLETFSNRCSMFNIVTVLRNMKALLSHDWLIRTRCLFINKLIFCRPCVLLHIRMASVTETLPVSSDVCEMCAYVIASNLLLQPLFTDFLQSNLHIRYGFPSEAYKFVIIIGGILVFFLFRDRNSKVNVPIELKCHA